jgi:3-methylcrotonyl-CoA carboxylase alpha subunit
MTYRPIRKLLIANRGEIASRILRTCKHLGISTVAVFSDADEDAPYVREADEAVRIGPPPSAESYLNVERILDAAKLSGADAVHPGFGFLAENASFAAAVKDAGLTWVGPSAEAITSMGLKREAKRIAVQAGVPVVPGYDGEDQSDAVLAAKAREIGYPVLVKASAGGGGKGMQIIAKDEDAQPALEAARRIAAASFGDDTLILEKYIERPRHVEIQIFGDEHGNLVHFWERECSIQRRHQKIIEEAPSPALDRELRQKMGEAALKIARAIGYTNAGTVEMILGEDKQFYFLEVNTRLQVEHPVTEAISDVDLVELQIRVARGEELPLDQDMIDTLMSGWAIECRVYAEDPAQGFLPQSGKILDWHTPAAEFLRIDTGVESGSEISIHYDPMIAKVITWGVDRGQAIDRMVWALERIAISGPRTNREYLVALLRHPKFEDGELSTHFIADHMGHAAEIERIRGSTREFTDGLFAITLHESSRGHRLLPSMRSGYRNNRYRDEEIVYLHGDSTIPVRYRDLGNGRYQLSARVSDAAGVPIDVEHELARVRVDGALVSFEELERITYGDGQKRVRGHRRTARVVSDGLRHHVHVGRFGFTFDEVPRFPDRTSESAADGAFAPMPGKIVRVMVSEGQEVKTGQTLVIMEAMKMEHSITAPHEGVVAELRVKEGQQVVEGFVLVVVKSPSDAPA